MTAEEIREAAKKVDVAYKEIPAEQQAAVGAALFAGIAVGMVFEAAAQLAEINATLKKLSDNIDFVKLMRE